MPTAIITSGVADVVGMSIDTLRNKLIWRNRATGLIETSDLDGSNRATLVAVPTSGGGVVYEPLGDFVYYGDNPAQEIRRIPAGGGSSVAVLTAPSTQVNNIDQMVVAGGRIYWLTLDGTQQFLHSGTPGAPITSIFQEKVVVTAANAISGVAVDVTGGHIFTTRTAAIITAGNHIDRLNIGGGGGVVYATITPGSLQHLGHLALDQTGREIFFASRAPANLDIQRLDSSQTSGFPIASSSVIAAQGTSPFAIAWHNNFVYWNERVTSTSIWKQSTLVDPDPPFLATTEDDFSPKPGDVDVALNTDIRIVIDDLVSPVDQATIKVTIDGIVALAPGSVVANQFTLSEPIVAFNNGFKFALRKPGLYQENRAIVVRVEASDTVPNALDTSYSFRTVKRLAIVDTKQTFLRSSQRHLGIGLAYPLRRNASGFFSVAFGKELVRQSIEQIIMTDPLERPLRVRNGIPFGTRVRRVLFEDFVTARDIAVADIRDALTVWEPRIQVLDIAVTEEESTLDDGRGTFFKIRIDFRFRASGEADFHVIEIDKEGNQTS